MDHSIDSGDSSVRGYITLIGKNSITHMHGLAVISRQLCRFLLMFSTGFTSLSVLILFAQWITLSLCMVFDSVSFDIDEVLSINPSANVFVYGGFNVHHKD